MLDYVLALVALSYGFKCLAEALLPRDRLLTAMRRQVEFVRKTDNGLRRAVEYLWFVLYVLIAWRLIR